MAAQPESDADHRRPGPGLVWLARSLFMVYVLALLIVVLSPSNAMQTEWVLGAQRILIDLGLTWRQATFGRVEMAANVVMVVPLGLLGVLSYPSSRWQTWTAYAFVGSLTVELVQGFVLPARQASTSDIVSNTLGALLGATVACGGLHLWAMALRSGPRLRVRRVR